jgi:hypothetical protein
MFIWQHRLIKLACQVAKQLNTYLHKLACPDGAAACEKRSTLVAIAVLSDSNGN